MLGGSWRQQGDQLLCSLLCSTVDDRLHAPRSHPSLMFLDIVPFSLLIFFEHEPKSLHHMQTQLQIVKVEGTWGMHCPIAIIPDFELPVYINEEQILSMCSLQLYYMAIQQALCTLGSPPLPRNPHHCRRPLVVVCESWTFRCVQTYHSEGNYMRSLPPIYIYIYPRPEFD